MITDPRRLDSKAAAGAGTMVIIRTVRQNGTVLTGDDESAPTDLHGELRLGLTMPLLLLTILRRRHAESLCDGISIINLINVQRTLLHGEQKKFWSYN